MNTLSLTASESRPHWPEQRSRRLAVVCGRPLIFRHLHGAMMKAILSATLAVGLCGLAGAQGNKADPVGTWKCDYEINSQKLTATVKIKMDGDKLAGTMSWPDQKDEKLKDVKLKESTLTFSVVRKFRGSEYPLAFTLTIEGDKFKGKSTAAFGSQEFDIEGKREKKDK